MNWTIKKSDAVRLISQLLEQCMSKGLNMDWSSHHSGVYVYDTQRHCMGVGEHVYLDRKNSEANLHKLIETVISYQRPEIEKEAVSE